MDNIKLLYSIANYLKDNYNDSYLYDYIQNKNSNELVWFAKWFFSQFKFKSVEELDYDEFSKILEVQKQFLSFANWDVYNKESSNLIDFEKLKYTTASNEDSSVFNKLHNLNAVNIIAYICVVSVFLYIFFVTFFTEGIEENRLRFVDQSLGNLYGILNIIIGFYCGGSYAKAKINK